MQHLSTGHDDAKRPVTFREIRTWQQITAQWWDEARGQYELFTSALVIAEASAGHTEAAARRLEALQGIAELLMDEEVQTFAERLILEGGIPAMLSTYQNKVIHRSCKHVIDVAFL